VRSLPITNWMMDYGTRDIAGLSWEVVPTPGMTNGASSYIVTLDGRRIGFVGEVICSEEWRWKGKNTVYRCQAKRSMKAERRNAI
jgi:glyoxylase-like metal-dependent hydrolase (beta-lactamase superfamily II)